MTPIEAMADAASRHPRVTTRLKQFNLREREFHVSLMKTQMELLGRKKDVQDLFLIQGHIEIQSLSKKMH